MLSKSSTNSATTKFAVVEISLLFLIVFCKIINGEIPSFKIYETEDLIAFLDISQATKGHTLIVPKKHYENLLALDEETLKKISVAQKEVANISLYFTPI